MVSDTWRRFAIIYGILLLVLPAWVFMFVSVGTLSVAGWLVLAVLGDGGPILLIQIAVWMAVEALLAGGLTWAASRVNTRTRQVALAVGAICALTAAASPIYCYFEGVQRSVGTCTNAIAAFRVAWW